MSSPRPFSPSVLNVLRTGLIGLMLVVPGGWIAAQRLPTELVLRDTPEGADPQRHLLETIYNEVLYPAAARRVEKTGMHLVALPVDSSGSVTDVLALTGIPENTEPVALTIVGYGLAGDMPAPEETTEDTGGTALREESLRVGRNLAEIGFRPRTVGGVSVADTLYLSFSFSLE